MVKVQKPQPKTLKKTTKSDGAVKEKPTVNKTIKKTSKATGLASAATGIDSKKIAAIKSDVKKSSERKNPKVTVEAKLKVAKLPQKTKSIKKPLVLAPPKSPVALPTKTSKKAAPVSVPVAAPTPKKAKTAKISKTAIEPVLKSVAKKNVKAEVSKTAIGPVLKSVTKKNVKAEVTNTKENKKQIKQSVVPATKNAKKQQQSVKDAKASKKVSEKTKPKLVTKKLAAAGNKKNKKGKISKQQNAIKQKEPKIVELKYELKSFDEDRFNEIVSEKNVEKVCSALMSQVREEVQKQKATPIFSDYRYILQVSSYKIPSCPKRVVKLALKHSLVGKDDDVAVIVTDLQRGARFDYEPTVQHYEDLFREAGIEQRLTIVPFNRLRNDMGTFEAKRKFLNSYDYLLCDGRISGQATAFLGNVSNNSSLISWASAIIVFRFICSLPRSLVMYCTRSV